MTKKKILICDDSPELSGPLKAGLGRIDALRKDFDEPEVASAAQFGDAINALELRLKQSAAGEISDYPNDDAAVIIDNASVLVIDYSLFDLNASVTGERIAYLARCYSKCGTIVAMNQYPPYVEEFFDLSLRGHLESYADLNIPSSSLANPNLWYEPWNGFRPWSWPLLSQSTEKLQLCISELKDHLTDKILEFLGFVDVKALSLPRSTTEFLSQEKPELTTFYDFVKSTGTGNGLRGRHERPINEEAIARIAAARISSWLENSILPGQNILVDAPHLALRFPSILDKKDQDIISWNKTASFLEPDQLGLTKIIEPSRFPKNSWLSRPAWFWNDLSDNEAIAEVLDPWSFKAPDFVFGEDVSMFIPKNEGRSFVADFESPFVRRHVKYLQPEIAYTPLVRFSL